MSSSTLLNHQAHY